MVEVDTLDFAPSASFAETVNILTFSDLALTLTSFGEQGKTHGVLTVGVILAGWLALGIAFLLADSFTWRPTTPPEWMRRQHESFLRAYWAQLHKSHRVWSAMVYLPSEQSSRFERTTVRPARLELATS